MGLGKSILLCAALLCALSFQVTWASNAAVAIANSSVASYVVVNASAEYNNSLNAGFNFTTGYFQSGSSLNCSLIQISQCDNNVPTQFVCINSSYYGAYSSQRQSLIKPGVCPDFVLAGTVGCSAQNGYCVVVDSRPGAYSSNQSSSTTLPPLTNQSISIPKITIPQINVTVNATTSGSIISGVSGLLSEIASLLAKLFHL